MSRASPCRSGEIGNLLIAGDSICSQYWNKHERTKATITGRWIATGDKYYQDEQGNYWYGGRSDDMLKVSGQWVSPVEVEAALIAYPAVLEAAVVGAEDDDGLVKPYAFVVLQADQPASEAMARDAEAARQDDAAAPQISALDLVRAGAAQDGDRQDSALSAARATGGLRGRLRWRLYLTLGPSSTGRGEPEACLRRTAGG